MTEEKDHSHGDQWNRTHDLPSRQPRLTYAELDDNALIDAMRAEDERALDEFIVRHQRLLFERARLAGFARRECEDYVIEVVEEIAMQIVAQRIRPTKTLAAYVVKCFFNRLADIGEQTKRRTRMIHERTEDAPARGERAVVSLVSEDAIRSSQGPDWESTPVSKALQRLAQKIEQGLSAEEEQMLAWQSCRIPLRQIAAWLGLTYDGAAQRSWRLRERLRRTATQFAFTLSPEDRRQLADFFDRCAVSYDHALRPDATHDPPTRSASGGE